MSYALSYLGNWNGCYHETVNYGKHHEFYSPESSRYDGEVNFVVEKFPLMRKFHLRIATMLREEYREIRNYLDDNFSVLSEREIQEIEIQRNRARTHYYRYIRKFNERENK